MKKSVAMVFLALLFVFLAGCKGGPKLPVKLYGEYDAQLLERFAGGTRLDSGGEYTVKAGDVVCFILDENETTPYHWFYEITAGNLVELLADEYQQDPNPRQKDGIGGEHAYYFGANAPGECSIVMRLHRVGDENDINTTVTYKLIIAE